MEPRRDLTTFIDRSISAFFLYLRLADRAQIHVWLLTPKIVEEEGAIEAQVQTTPYSELAE